MPLVLAQFPGIADRLTVVRTPTQGWHIWYRCPETVIPGNKKLAIDPERPHNDRTLIETRGDGGYAIIPGSPPQTHSLNRPYEHVEGPPFAALQEVTAAEREALLVSPGA
jgi:putative DNA primase/helicase